MMEAEWTSEISGVLPQYYTASQPRRHRLISARYVQYSHQEISHGVHNDIVKVRSL